MSTAVDTALAAKLATVPDVATLAPGGIHNMRRAQGCRMPCIVFGLVSDFGGAQTYGSGGVERLQYDVRVIGTVADGGQANVGALVAAIHVVLERGTLTLASGQHLQTMRDRRLTPREESVGGVDYLTRGATYSVWATAT